MQEVPRGAFALAALTVGLLLSAGCWSTSSCSCRAAWWAEPCRSPKKPSSGRSCAGRRSSIGVVSVIMLAIIYAGLVHHINPPSNLERIDPKTLHLVGRVHRAESRHARRGRRPDHQPDRRHAVRLRAALRRAAGEPAGDAALRHAGRDPRHPGHRHQCQHDDRAGLREPGAHGVHAHGRSADAVPRILRPRPQRDVGDGARRAAGPSSSPTREGRVSCDAR